MPGPWSAFARGRETIVRPKVWLPTWQELPQGTALGEGTLSGVTVGPGGSLGNYTGTWRTITPKYDREKCVRCLRCWFCCPEGCIKRLEDDHVKWDYRYCKGCGICANICPADAIHMVKGADGTMMKVLSADHAVAWGVRLAKAEVIPAFPITPQTLIIELLSEFIFDGDLDAEFIPADSEHSAMSIAVGASARRGEELPPPRHRKAWPSCTRCSMPARRTACPWSWPT